MMTQQQARAGGKALLARVAKVYPRVFKLRVYKNLDWHYCVENDFLSVSPLFSGEKPYQVYFQPHYQRCGKVQYHNDPIKAIRLAFKAFEDTTNDTITFLTNAQNSLHP